MVSCRASTSHGGVAWHERHLLGERPPTHPLRVKYWAAGQRGAIRSSRFAVTNSRIANRSCTHPAAQLDECWKLDYTSFTSFVLSFSSLLFAQTWGECPLRIRESQIGTGAAALPQRVALAMGDARGEHWQEDLRACGCEEANRMGVAANCEWRIANGEWRIVVKATNPSCVQGPPHVCNTGCVNKGL